MDELPIAHVEAAAETGYYGGGPGMRDVAASRWDETPSFGSGYSSPGWRRAQERTAAPYTPPAGVQRGFARRNLPIEGEGRLVATAAAAAAASAYKTGERVFHQKFGYGLITLIEGNKLTIDFEKAGEKKVLDSFVEKGG